MTTRDLKSNVDAAISFNGAAVTTDTAADQMVDLLGYNSAFFLFFAGAISSAGLVKAVPIEGDTSTVGSATDVAAGDLDGTFTNATAQSVQRVGYKGSKRYVGLRMDYTSGTSVYCMGCVVRGDPERAPLA
jgi:hypothetical protein